VLHIDHFLKFMVERDASDLYVKAFNPPMLRVNGETVAQSNDLKLPELGHLAMQMHQRGARIEYLKPRVKHLESKENVTTN